MTSSQSHSRKRPRRESDLHTSPKRKKTTTYDASFRQHLIDFAICPESYDEDECKEPATLEGLNGRLGQRRQSLSSSRRQAFLNFKRKSRETLTNASVISKLFPIIAGNAEISSRENLYFGNLLDQTVKSIVKSTNPKHQIEYRMTQLRGFSLTSSPEAFREGATFLRNGRDWVKDERKALIIAENGKTHDAQTGS